MEEFSTQDLNLEETGTSTQLRSIQWIAGADSDLETSFQWIVGAGDGFDSSSLQFYGDAIAPVWSLPCIGFAPGA